MNRHSLPIMLIASLITGQSLLQLACGGHALNNNDQAQVVSANVPNPTPEATGAPSGSPELPDSRVVHARRITRESIERNADTYRQRAAAEGSKIGDGPDDLWLWFQARSRLASTILIDVDQAVVTLRGTVDTQADADEAAAGVRQLDGVKDVVNQLTITKPQ